MGQRSATETLFAIVSAFIEERTWAQAALARKLEITVPAVRKRLEELRAGGSVPLERDDSDPPQVYWSVPKGWYPGALIFKRDEIADLLRTLARAPHNAARSRVLKLVLARLPSQATASDPGTPIDPTMFRTPEVDAAEEQWLGVVEDAASKRVALRMRYYTASRRDEGWRHASVHRVDVGARSRFVATCHRTGALRWFRVANVLHAALDPAEPFRAVARAALEAFERESVAGYHEEGPVVRCAFVVRDPEAAWVARNLLDGMKHEKATGGGVRVSVDTTAVVAVARYVVGLGGAAVVETPELAREVTSLARGALANAGTSGHER